jgi:hypothetical protein
MEPIMELLDREAARCVRVTADNEIPASSGRKGFGTRALVGACLVKALFGLPIWTWVAALIAEHPGLQARLGATPSVWAMYRFARKLRKNPSVARGLHRQRGRIASGAVPGFWT